MPLATSITVTPWQPEYEPWRHGGWYVCNVDYPMGCVGCVSNNYEDKKWRVMSDHTETPFPSRDTAARAERVAAAMLTEAIVPIREAADALTELIGSRNEDAIFDATDRLQKILKRYR